MAEYDITRTCGHVETVQIQGLQRERASRAQWEESLQCRACKGAKQAAERSAALEAAQAATAVLQPLTGSPKQVAWATTIRADMLALARAAITANADTMNDEGRARVTRGLAVMEGITDAKWWIDHRPSPPAWSSPKADRLYALKLLENAGGKSR